MRALLMLALLALTLLACTTATVASAQIASTTPTVAAAQTASKTPTIHVQIPTATLPVMTITGNWNIRACPSLSCSVVCWMYDGQTAVILETSDNDAKWVKVHDGTCTGWKRNFKQ